MPGVQMYTGCALRPKGVAIDKVSCNDISRVPLRNLDKCHAIKCASPWRLCLTCVRSGVRDAGIVNNKNLERVADGLCDFHAKNGAEATPPRQTIPAPVATARLLDRPVALPAIPAIVISQEPEPSPQPQPRVAARPLSRLEAIANREKTMPATTSLPSIPAEKLDPATLADRVEVYRTEHKLSIAGLAHLCGLSPAPFYQLKKGDKPLQQKTIDLIENVLAGRGGALNGSATAFDATCERLIGLVIVQAGERNELDQLLRATFIKWVKGKNPDDAESFVGEMLRKLLSTQPDEERLGTLLELRDGLKP